jgi:hypothetical protein
MLVPVCQQVNFSPTSPKLINQYNNYKRLLWVKRSSGEQEMQENKPPIGRCVKMQAYMAVYKTADRCSPL